MELKKFRQEKNMTQKEIANFLNLQVQTYQNYELGKRQPDIQTLIKLADFYKVTLDELVGHEVPYLLKKIDFSDAQLTLIKELKTLDNLNCQKVIAYIKGLKDR